MNKDIQKTLKTLALVTVGWLAASIIVSSLGWFDQPDAPPTFFGLFVAGPIVGFTLAYWLNKRVRAALLAIPLWLVVATHSLRFVGIFFIAGALSGELVPQFGWPAGVGDVIAAVISIPLAFSVYHKRYTKWLKARFTAWNIFGLLDLFSAIVLGLLYSVSELGFLGTPESNTQSATHLPMSLIPTFYVPILILLHFLAIRRRHELTSPRS